MEKETGIRGNLALERKKVIVIEAAEQPEAAKLRVAAYCRVSSDSNDQLNSFVAQMNHYTTLIGTRDTWTMVDIYADEGITGTSVDKRKDFQRLIADCHKGLVDKILVKSISRFARNTTDCLETIRELKAIGVGVIFEEQNIDTSKMSGELLTTMFAAIAQKESESISGNMRWSYQRRMESGTYVPTTLPYGYVRKNGKIEIDNDRAAVVRRIFSDYLAGRSSHDIAATLTAENVPCRYGGTNWNAIAVRYILANEKYTGNSLWQKYYTTDILPYRYLRNRGERPAYYAEHTHAPILPIEDFEAARRLMEIRKEQVTPTQNIPYPFRQKIRCGKCGTVFRRKGMNGIIYWACMGHDSRGKQFCPVTQIPEETIQAAFLRLYHKLMLHGEAILTQLLSDLQTIRERQLLWSVDVIELNKQISDINDQERMLAGMNKLGLVDPDIFISQSNDLARQLRAVKQEKERLMEDRDDDTIPRTRELLESLETMPEFLPAFDGEIFTDLMEQIVVVSNDCLRFRLRNGLELAEPIERTVR